MLNTLVKLSLIKNNFNLLLEGFGNKQSSSLETKFSRDDANILNFLRKYDDEDNYLMSNKDHVPSKLNQDRTIKYLSYNENYRKPRYDGKPCRSCEYKKSSKQYSDDRKYRKSHDYKMDKMNNKCGQYYGDKNCKNHYRDDKKQDYASYQNEYKSEDVWYQSPAKINFADKVYQPKDTEKTNKYQSDSYGQYSSIHESYSPYSSYDKSPYYKSYDSYPSTSYPSGQHPSYDPYSYVPRSFDPYPSPSYTHDTYSPRSYHFYDSYHTPSYSHDVYSPHSYSHDQSYDPYGSAHMKYDYKPDPYDSYSTGSYSHDDHHYRDDSYGPHSSYNLYGSYRPYHQPRPVTYYPDPYPKPLAPVPYIPGITDLTKEFKSAYPISYKAGDYGYDGKLFLFNIYN